MANRSSTDTAAVDGIPAKVDTASIPTLPLRAFVAPNLSEALNIFAMGFAGAAAAMGVVPKVVSRTMAWGPGKGWIREIVIWNIGTLIGLRSISTSDDTTKRGVIRGYTVTSALFAVNHLAAGLTEPRKVGHWATGLMNVSAVLTGLGALRRDKNRP